MNICRVGILLAVVLIAIPAFATDQVENYCPIERDRVIPQPQVSPGDLPEVRAMDDPPYWQGTLRVYVVEEESSMNWTSGGQPYDFPFLAFAINSGSIVMNDRTWDTTVTWDGYDFGYNYLEEDNIAVQAVMFAQADGLPEAAAMAFPGEPGSNYANPDSGYTHTVFVEEGTASW